MQHDTFNTDGIVKLDFNLNINGLAALLQNMNTEIVRNAKLIAGLTEDFFQLRKMQDDFRVKLKDILAKADRHRGDLDKKVGTLQDDLKKLPEVYVGAKDFSSAIGNIHQLVAQTSQRLTDVESSTGSHFRQVVETHVTGILDDWYEPIKDREQCQQRELLAETRTDLEQKIGRDMGSLENTTNLRLQNAMKLCEKNLKTATDTIDEHLNSIRRLQEFDKRELQEAITSNDLNIKFQLRESNQATNGRFNANEGQLAALFDVLCMKPGDVVDLYSTKDNPDFADYDTDRRVDYVHNTLPFLELRSKTQTDIRTRIKQMKEEDQDDFSTQVLELQRELKTKATIQKVLQLIHENMDKGLYETVDFVKTKLTVLESDKVSVDHFCEAMKTKSDLKLLDGKADRSFVNSLFEFLRAKFEQFQEGHLTEVSQIVDTALKNRGINMEDNIEAKHGGGKTLDKGYSEQLMVRSGELRGNGSRQPTSIEDKGRIEAALNPQAEYQWVSAVGQRQGMPPARNIRGGAGGVAIPYSYDSQRGMDGRELVAKQTSMRRPPSHQSVTKPPSEDIMSWADTNSAAPEDLPTLPPLPNTSPSPPLLPQPPKTRAHEAYMKAVHDANTHLATAIEDAPTDAYVPEASRHPLRGK